MNDPHREIKYVKFKFINFAIKVFDRDYDHDIYKIVKHKK